MSSPAITEFIARWTPSGGNELANSQPFFVVFCRLLGLPEHHPAQDVNEENAYSFERKVYLPRGDGSAELKRIDLSSRGRFILEAKQGRAGATRATLALPVPGLTQFSAVRRGTRAWEEIMSSAKRQAETYVRSLPAREGSPLFIIVADAGHCFDLSWKCNEQEQ